MPQILIRRSDHGRKVFIERVDPADLVVEFPEQLRQIGRIDGLGPVVEGTGKRNTRKLLVRRQLRYQDGKPMSIGFLASISVSEVGQYVRRPHLVDMETVEQLDAEVKAAEANLAEIKRRRAAMVLKAFEGGTPASRDEMTSAAAQRAATSI